MPKHLSKLTENSPLKGKQILVTRSEDQAKDFMEMLEVLGAKPILFPTIQIIPPQDWVYVDRAIKGLESYDTLIFTSVNGVKFFFQRIKEKKKDFSFLKNLRICAIGPKTAEEIEQFKLQVDIIPKKFQAEAVVDSLEKEGIAGRRFLLPRAEKAREVLPDEVKNKGGYIDVVTVYRTSKGEGDIKEIKELFQKRLIDVITFTSSSTVKNFIEVLAEDDNINELIKNSLVASIGPITAETAASFGIKTDIMPEQYTIPGLLEAIWEYFCSSPKRSEVVML